MQEPPIQQSQTPDSDDTQRLSDVVPGVTARIRDGVRQRQESAERKEQIDRQRNINRLARQIGKRYSRCRFSNYVIDETIPPEDRARQERSFKAIREWAKNIDQTIEAGQNLVLYGSVGTGKDHLLAACCMSACSAGFSVEFRNASEVFMAAKATWGKFGETVDDVLNPLIRADVLALSDPIPGIGEPDEHEVRWLLSVIDKRYREMRPTWITLNAVSSEDAGKSLSFQLIDRLKHGSLAVSMRWPSYRKLSQG